MDRADIQTKIDEANNNGGGVVEIPPGRHDLDGPLVLPLTGPGMTGNGGVHLVGHGPASTLVGTSEFGETAESRGKGKGVALIEWATPTGPSPVFHAFNQRIAGLRLVLPPIEGTMGIYRPIDGIDEGSGKRETTRLQVQLENVRVDGYNSLHSSLIRLRGSVFHSTFTDVRGGVWPFIQADHLPHVEHRQTDPDWRHSYLDKVPDVREAQEQTRIRAMDEFIQDNQEDWNDGRPYAHQMVPRYCTTLLHFDSGNEDEWQNGGNPNVRYDHEADYWLDAIGLQYSRLTRIWSTWNGGGFSTTLKGRLNRVHGAHLYNDGALFKPAFHLINCNETTLEHLSNEGGAENPTLLMEGCHGIHVSHYSLMLPRMARIWKVLTGNEYYKKEPESNGNEIPTVLFSDDSSGVKANCGSAGDNDDSNLVEAEALIAKCGREAYNQKLWGDQIVLRGCTDCHFEHQIQKHNHRTHCTGETWRPIDVDHSNTRIEMRNIQVEHRSHACRILFEPAEGELQGHYFYTKKDKTRSRFHAKPLGPLLWWAQFLRRYRFLRWLYPSVCDTK